MHLDSIFNRFTLRQQNSSNFNYKYNGINFKTIALFTLYSFEYFVTKSIRIALSTAIPENRVVGYAIPVKAFFSSLDFGDSVGNPRAPVPMPNYIH